MIGTAFICFYAFMALACFILLWFTRNDRGWLRGMSFTCMAMCVGLSGLVAGLCLMTSGNWNRPIGDPLPQVEKVEVLVEKEATPRPRLEMPSPTMRSMTRDEQERVKRQALESALADARRQADEERRRAREQSRFAGPYEYNPPQGELSRYAYEGEPDFREWIGVEKARQRVMPDPAPYPAPTPPGEGDPSVSPLDGKPREVWFPPQEDEPESHQ